MRHAARAARSIAWHHAHRSGAAAPTSTRRQGRRMALIVDDTGLMPSASTGPSGSTHAARTVLPVANAGLGQRAARPPAALASVGAIAVVAVVVHVPAGPPGGAGAPAEPALRQGALGRHARLPPHRRAVAVAHSASLCGPTERMWTDTACPRPPPRRDPGIDAPICQDKRLDCLRDVSAHAEVCHNTLVGFTGEEAFEAADDLASGPAASRSVRSTRGGCGAAAVDWETPGISTRCSSRSRVADSICGAQ